MLSAILADLDISSPAELECADFFFVWIMIKCTQKKSARSNSAGDEISRSAKISQLRTHKSLQLCTLSYSVVYCVTKQPPEHYSFLKKSELHSTYFQNSMIWSVG